MLIADDDLADKHSYMRMVQSRRVDALIVAHTLDHDPRLEQLQAAGFPGAWAQPAAAAVRVV
jgi:LacI family transcriptional regulator